MIREFFITFRNGNRKGLSERLVKRRLERDGWIVWRSEHIGILRNHNDLFPNVQKKYELLSSLIEIHHPGVLESLQYMNTVNHGLPDFVAFKDGFKFVECKIGYEPLRVEQKKAIKKLLDMGFVVELHRLAEPQMKTIKAEIDPHTHVRHVKELQKKLKR